MTAPLTFLKLGGSLITDKERPKTSRPGVLERLAWEIQTARAQKPSIRLVLGHGSGSFGHVPARQYATRQGVRSPEGWRGFGEVWFQAASLNHLVMAALHRAGVPCVAFPPSAAVSAERGRIHTWDLAPLQAALAAGLVPVVFGDVVFDTRLGGTILSTEDVLAYLARHLSPRQVLLAGMEPGVWADYPTCTRVLEEITPGTIAEVLPALQGSAAPDVTGGMADKVDKMLALVQELPDLEVRIFSGEQAGLVREALLGTHAGTRLAAGRVADR